MMSWNKGVKIAVVAIISILFIATFVQAREIKGKTESYDKRIMVTAIATDGSSFTDRVNRLKRVRLHTGLIRYYGSYSLEVPEGQKVMIVFQKVRTNGTLAPKTVARFATGTSGLNSAGGVTAAAGTETETQFTVTAGLAPVNLGLIRVKNMFAKPAHNPLSRVDNDEDGISDLNDNDDDNDGIDDNQDEDKDGDGIFNLIDDMDTDDDNKPDIIDTDDDNDSINDKTDLDDDDDGIPDWDGDTDSDDDGIDDADDPDDDNDGISDDQDYDQDGNGIFDRVENDSDQDGIIDSCDNDDDNDGIEDSQDDDNDDDGISDDDEQDQDEDGIPDDSDN